jgi:DNA-binding MarR family transcriptional regulator
MHFMMPALKRAHLWSLALTREAAEEHELTAARFDLMHFVMTRGRPRQFEISRALGVSAVTISRMVRRLEELGLIVRSASASGRKKWVGLTTEGLRRVRAMIESVLTPNRFRRDYEGVFGRPGPRARFIVDELYFSVRAIAEKFGHWTSKEWVWYAPTPGHPDD